MPHADLLVAGNDEEGYAARLAAIADSLGIRQRVVFCGPVYGGAKTTLYRRATVFALPSYSENFGNAVLEAMHEGCPVVVTPEVGAAAVVAEAGAGAVSPGDPATLAACLGRLLADPHMRAEMGSRGRKSARERYTWDAVATRMMQVYQGLAGARGGAA